MKSELQKAREAEAKEKEKFVLWLKKKIDSSPRGTLTRLAEHLKSTVPHVHDYTRGKRHPDALTRKHIKKYFENNVT